MEKDYVGEEWFDILPHVIDDLRTGAFEEMAAQKQYANPLEVGDAVTVELYGKVIPGKVVATHNPGDGYGQSVEVELSEAWRGAKKLWFSADEIERVENVDMVELPF